VSPDTAAAREGEVHCPKCGMSSRTGATCEWCHQPLALQASPLSRAPAPVAGVAGEPREMPGVVRAARLLALIAAVLGGLLFAMVLLMAIGGKAEVTVSSPALLPLVPVIPWFFVALMGILVGVSLWLFRALAQGTPAAWSVGLVWSVIGLAGFPVGTIINGLILHYWVRPETKAWFRQAPRPIAQQPAALRSTKRGRVVTVALVLASLIVAAAIVGGIRLAVGARGTSPDMNVLLTQAQQDAPAVMEAAGCPRSLWVGVYVVSRPGASPAIVVFPAEVETGAEAPQPAPGMFTTPPTRRTYVVARYKWTGRQWKRLSVETMDQCPWPLPR